MSRIFEDLEKLSLDEKRALLAELLKKKISGPKRFPLSYAQERLWFLDQLEPGSAFYNIPASFRVRGELNIGALERSLNEIVRRHESLRTTFRVQDGKPVQVIEPGGEQQLKVRDLAGWGAQAEVEAQRLVNEEGQRPFDLAVGPLVRSELLRLGERDYVLLLTMHHIVSDGWSAGIFMRELSTLYESYSLGRSSPLAELPIQYADYAVWQRERLQGELLAAELAYWREQLRGMRPLLELPTDRGRPAVQRYRGAYQGLQLSESLGRGLQALSERAGVTLFMSLVAAFKILLWRYSGEREVVVGTPIAGRTRAETEKLIGFFVNTLVLRTRLSGEENFWGLLRQVREVTLGAYAHQELPFEKLVEELQPERNLSYNPLFQVMFVLQNDPQGTSRRGVASGGEAAESDGGAGAIVTGTAKFDLTLTLMEQGGGLVGAVEYNTDLFNGERVRRLIGHYEQLLRGIVTNPEQRLDRLALLTEAERGQLLSEWNKGVGPAVRGTVLELWEAQVAREPERPALVSGEQQLSYGELERRANQWGHYLRAAGVGAETVVGICLRRGLEQVVAVLAVLKSGAAYLPLEASHPPERLELMLRETAAALVITEQALADKLKTISSAKVISIDQEASMSDFPTNSFILSTDAQDMALVTYTDQDAGEHRAVPITHEDLLNAVVRSNESFGITANDRVINFSSLSFVVNAQMLFATLLNGARLYLAPPDGDEQAENLPMFIRENEISTIAIPATSLLELRGKQLSSLNTVIMFGEPISLSSLDAAPGKRYLHLWLPIGAPLFQFCAEYEKGDRLPRQVLGKSLSNKKYYVLDERLEPLPIGITGELFIDESDPGRGYLNQADLTTRNILPNPFSAEAGARLSASGELVRFNDDGKLEYFGQRKERLDRDGRTVNLKEIEWLIKGHPNVLQAVLTSEKDDAGNTFLIAYVMMEQTSPSAIIDLRRFVEQQTPDYMRPTDYFPVDRMDLRTNGNVDRKALPGFETTRSKLHESVTPRNALEYILAEVWKDILELDRVSIHDNFFQLGGHSLLATMANFRISDALGIEVPLTALFEAPTIAGLATKLIQDPQHGQRIQQVSELLVTVDELSDDAVKALMDGE
jgi:aspartate racemase